METTEEIINNIFDKIKGKKFIKIPIWYDFANHVAYINRFGGSPTKDNVCSFIDEILKRKEMIYHISKGKPIYRARKIPRNEIKKNETGKWKGFDKKHSGMPPYRETPNGRANIAGIPVFYTATEKETACAEIRPMKNDYISLAIYEIIEDMDVANFTLEQVQNVEKQIQGQLFLKNMFESFSMPISNELIDYLPSEFISEYIRLKHTNLSGIRYSSLHNSGGYNIALFNDKKCEFKESVIIECSKVNYEFNELL